MDFIALDVETANSDLSSICSIGLVSFNEGIPGKSLYFLIDPQDKFDGMNISIHGITPDHVIGQPTMREVFPIISQQLSGLIVAHHTPFDRVAFKRCSEKYGFDEADFSWIDTARVARRAWERFSKSGYGLADLAIEFEITFEHHHAAEDARVAGLILSRAIESSGLTLEQWLERAQQPLNDKKTVHATSGNPDGPLYGEVIVFTGALEIPRHEAVQLAVQAGCDVRNSVTKATTLLVIGDQDVRRFAGNEKSAKHQKAEGMIRDGAKLRIISERDFSRLISL